MSNYLEEVERQLVELTERGAHRRSRLRHDAVALAVAVVTAAAVAAAITTLGSRAHRSGAPSHRSSTLTHPQAVPHHHPARVTTSTVSSSPPPLGGAVPSGFGATSFTAVDDLTWWLLGSAPCSSPPCTSIVRTADGGRTFAGIPAPRTQNVSQLRFANVRDGFAYGPELWVTHDGGARWQAIQVQGQVRDLAIGGGYAYEVIVNPSSGVGQLLRSPVATNAWSALPAAGDASGGLWVHGSDVLLETAGNRLMVSHDYGASFASYPVPPSVACQFEEPASPVVWAHCATGMLSGTSRSADGGRSFTPVRGSIPEQPNSAAFGAASADTAVVGYRELYRTTDGGASWAPVVGPVGITWWQYLGFTDPTHGVAIGYVGSQQPSNERLYYTTDGGANYHLVRIG
jgi:photosystem II stability/assembly factor-like uncharacterized protein